MNAIVNDRPTLKTAYVFSGGAMKGAMQAGFIAAAEEAGHYPDAVFGISAGALCAVFEAMGKRKELQELWRELARVGSGLVYTSSLLHDTPQGLRLDTSELTRQLGLKFSFKLLAKVAFGGTDKLLQQVQDRAKVIVSIADNTPLLKLLQKHVRRSEIKIPIRTGRVCLCSGEYVIDKPEDFDSDYEYCQAILASATMPGMWPPVKHIQSKTRVWNDSVDGGLRTNAPLDDALDFIRESGEEVDDWEVVCVNCNAPGLEYQPPGHNLADSALRTLNIMMDQLLRDDLDGITRINKLLTQLPKGVVLRSPSGKPYKPVWLTVIEPKGRELGDMLDVSPHIIDTRIQIGLRYGRAFFAEGRDVAQA